MYLTNGIRLEFALTAGQFTEYNSDGTTRMDLDLTKALTIWEHVSVAYRTLLAVLTK